MADDRLRDGPPSLPHLLFGEEPDSRARIEELLGIVTHDLRSPLANIRSYASMILSGRGPPPEPRVERAARVIAKNADRGLRQIEDLVDLLRAQSHQLELEREELSISEVIQGALERADPLAKDRKVELHWERNGGDLSLSGDPEKLSRAVTALIEAGIRRTPEGGEISVQLEAAPASIRIVVEDEGPLLGEEERRQAFDWLHQILANNRLVAGLSLALAQTFLEGHGGEVGVEAMEREGARWFALLPRSG